MDANNSYSISSPISVVNIIKFVKPNHQMDKLEEQMLQAIKSITLFPQLPANRHEKAAAQQCANIAEETAKQKSIDFHEWIMLNYFINKRNHTTAQLYEIFLNSV